MSIDLSKVVGWDADRGALVQITDASGRVLWSAEKPVPAVLTVAKQSFTSYSGETSYSSNCILLDIYPKSANSTVKVTYGGLIKTLTFSGRNAKQVYFGTFNGVADSVETPVSGTLTIEGDYYAVGVGSYTKDSKGTTDYCECITAVHDLGGVKEIPNNCFNSCALIESIAIPDGVKSIQTGAFYSCSKLKNLKIPASVTAIGSYNNPAYAALNDSTFLHCSSLTNIVVNGGNKNYSSENGILYSKDKSVLIIYPSASGDFTVPNTVTEIWSNAFYGVEALTSITLPASVSKIGENAFASCTNLTSITILATTPPVFEVDALSGNGYNDPFSGVTCSFTVPKGCGETYESSEWWSQYADKIVEAS